ncbi:MAG: ABC transporter ATP-binding protein [Ignavibacteria bacterium]|nr:ABC transporter ATP-binding protein [Ignavibacteria bacterium]
MLRKGTSQISFLLAYYRPHTTKIIVALLFMLPSSGISLLFPMLTGGLIDGILKADNPSNLYTVGALFLGLLLVQAAVGYAISITLATITENVIAALRLDLFSHIVRTPLSYLSQKRVGDLTSRLSSDLALIQETFSFSVLQILRQSVFLIGSVVIIVMTSVELTIPILLVTPIIVLIALTIGKKIRKLSTKTQDALAVTSTIVEESLQSVAAVKSFVRELYESARYGEALKENVRLAIKGAKLRALFVTFIIFTVFGGIAAVILYGANLVSVGAITMGELLSFLMYAMFVGGALGSFAELFGQVQKTLGAAVRVSEIMETPTEGLNDAISSPPLVIHNIELRDLYFEYPDREDQQVLQGISLEIPRGARVAFVGQSGAGKSTTASIIQRLYEPTKGEILYNNQPGSDFTLQQIRSAIAIVPQDVVLFGGTIADNILYGNPAATMEMVKEAARNANAYDFIQEFPEGFETLVGERGTKLSGGQRQRIAIARAVLKNPSVLILDEATSSLDAESEGLIQDALQKLMINRTAVIIAHRLSTVRTADLIIVFEKGKIVESGTHKDLIAISGGRYQHWCDLQFLT